MDWTAGAALDGGGEVRSGEVRDVEQASDTRSGSKSARGRLESPSEKRMGLSKIFKMRSPSGKKKESPFLADPCQCLLPFSPGDFMCFSGFE